MIMNKGKKKWTVNEIANLEKYVAKNSNELISNLYKNILVGYIRFAKPYGFFTGLSRILKRSRAQCKAKFYEMEDELYIKILQVPFDDLCLFMNIRQQKLDRKNNENHLQSRKDFDILSKKGESGSLIKESNQSQKSEIYRQSLMSDVEEGEFYQMRNEQIKQRRLKIMNQYLNKELDFTFRNKGI